MSKNRIIAVVVVAVVLVLVGAFLLIKRPPSGAPITSVPAGGVAAQPSGPPTKEVVPQNIIVPSQNDKNNADVPANLAVPTAVSQANMEGTSNYRVFNIKVEGGKFTPDTVAVYFNDQIVLNITAVDENYDFTQPDFGYDGIAVPKGTTKTIYMQATEIASFMFYCKSCGGPTDGPVGYLLVAPKKKS